MANNVFKKTVSKELVNTIHVIDVSKLVWKNRIWHENWGNSKKRPNHDKYTTKNNFNKCSSTIFDERLKHAKFATKYDIADFIADSLYKTHFDDKLK